MDFVNLRLSREMLDNGGVDKALIKPLPLLAATFRDTLRTWVDCCLDILKVEDNWSAGCLFGANPSDEADRFKAMGSNTGVE